jgi:hypothetical protein
MKSKKASDRREFEGAPRKQKMAHVDEKRKSVQNYKRMAYDVYEEDDLESSYHLKAMKRKNYEDED